MILKQYYTLLGEVPNFLKKYLYAPSLVRLKNIGYFCGMDYASKNIYNFKEYISRYDHSLSVALLTWKFTKDKCATLSGLFHDISTPCFSHVIDYMNNDYIEQESTEEYTKDILNKDEYLLKHLKEDGISLEEIVDFKNFSIVDNKRPKLCADRLDGVILTGLFWTKSLTINEVKIIIENIDVFKNEDGFNEIGFKSKEVAELVLGTNEKIDFFCHSKEDIYMMELLANITKRAIEVNLINYNDLYILDEKELINILDKSNDNIIIDSLNYFRTISIDEISDFKIADIKKRILNPLVDGKRLK